MPSSSFTKPSTLMFPVTVDIMKFVFSKSELLWGRPPSLIAAALIQIAQKVLRSSSMPSDVSPFSLKWLSQNQWDAKMQLHTGIKQSDFEEMATLFEQAYKANGGGNAQHLIFN